MSTKSEQDHHSAFYASAELYTNPRGLKMTEEVKKNSIVNGQLIRFEKTGEVKVKGYQLGTNLVVVSQENSVTPEEMYDLADALLEVVPHPINHLPRLGFNVRGTRCYTHGSFKPDYDIGFFCETPELVSKWIEAFQSHSNATLYAKPRYKMTRSGYMKKLPLNYASRRRKFLYSWKRRFFVLAGPILTYYSEEDESRRSLKGELNIINLSLIKDAPLPKYCNQALSFELKGEHTVISFTCYSAHEREAWISSIERVLRGDYFLEDADEDSSEGSSFVKQRKLSQVSESTEATGGTKEGLERVDTGTSTGSRETQGISPGSKILTEMAGRHMTAAISKCGALLVWGQIPMREFDNFRFSQTIFKGNDYKLRPSLGPPLTPLRVVHVSTGRAHIAAIVEDGGLYTWGIGMYGRLGHGDDVDTPRPRLVKALRKEVIVSASCGGQHTVCISREGAVYAFGRGKEWQLGTGMIGDVYTPELITALSGEKIIDISAGHSHTVCVTESGSVYQFGSIMGILYPKPRIVSHVGKYICRVTSGIDYSFALKTDGRFFAWGRNENAQLGIGSREVAKTPMRVPTESRFNSISSRASHSAAISTKQELFTWGSTGNGRLGHGDIDEPYFDAPHFVYMLQGRAPVAASAGYDHTVAISDDGALYVFGSTEFDKLTGEAPDDGKRTEVDMPLNVMKRFAFASESWQDVPIPTGQSTPRPREAETPLSSIFRVKEEEIVELRKHDVIPGDLTDRMIMPRQRTEVAGSRMTALISAHGELYLCGRLEKCTLPTDSDTFVLQRDLTIEKNENVVQISINSSHILAVTEAMHVYAWGYNGHGQLGAGEGSGDKGALKVSKKPLLIEMLSEMNIVVVSAGWRHSLFVTATGDVLSCGFNETGQLGYDTGGESVYTPQMIATFVTEDISMYTVSAGRSHSIGCTMKGEVWIWGSQGLQSETDFSPRRVRIVGRARAVSAGMDMSLVASENGDLYEFGNNAISGSCDTVTHVSGVSDVISVSAGWNHWIALTTKSECYEFGKKEAEEALLSKDSWISPHLVRNSIIEQSYVVCVSAGKTHTVVVTDVGVLLTWGKSKHGQCGIKSEIVDHPRVVDVFEKLSDRHKRSVFLTCGIRHFHFDIIEDEQAAKHQRQVFNTIRGKTARLPPPQSDEPKEQDESREEDTGDGEEEEEEENEATSRENTREEYGDSDNEAESAEEDRKGEKYDDSDTTTTSEDDEEDEDSDNS